MDESLLRNDSSVDVLPIHRYASMLTTLPTLISTCLCTCACVGTVTEVSTTNFMKHVKVGAKKTKVAAKEVYVATKATIDEMKKEPTSFHCKNCDQRLQVPPCTRARTYTRTHTCNYVHYVRYLCVCNSCTYTCAHAHMRLCLHSEEYQHTLYTLYAYVCACTPYIQTYTRSCICSLKHTCISCVHMCIFTNMHLTTLIRVYMYMI